MFSQTLRSTSASLVLVAGCAIAVLVDTKVLGGVEDLLLLLLIEQQQEHRVHSELDVKFRLIGGVVHTL
jgi:hypothetical protein